jgi:hypothetical protein
MKSFISFLKNKLFVILFILLFTGVQNTSAKVSFIPSLSNPFAEFSSYTKDWNYVYTMARLRNKEKRSKQIADLVVRECKAKNLNTKLIARQIYKESKFKWWVKSYTTNRQGVKYPIAYGIMMVHLKIWAHKLYYIKQGKLIQKIRTYDDMEKLIIEPENNIIIGTDIISYYVKKYDGDYEKGLTAYFAGGSSEEMKQLLEYDISNHYSEDIIDGDIIEREVNYRIKNIGFKK